MNQIINIYRYDNGIISPIETVLNYKELDEIPLIINTKNSSKLPTEYDILNFQKYDITKICVEDTIILENSAQILEFIRFLREITSLGIRVSWNGKAEKNFPIKQINHLYPPETLEGVENEKLITWQNSYRYGQFYMRMGLDFIKIKDKRPFHSPLIYTIGDPDIRSILDKFFNPIHISKLTDLEKAATSMLLKYNFLLEIDDTFLRLPYRIKKWPIPAFEI